MFLGMPLDAETFKEEHEELGNIYRDSHRSRT
jgi:hypothetical protein